jgi:hypothetical protein
MPALCLNPEPRDRPRRFQTAHDPAYSVGLRDKRRSFVVVHRHDSANGAGKTNRQFPLGKSPSFD